MPKILSPEQIDTFSRDGCVFPIRVISAAEARAIRDQLEDFERSTGGPLKGDLRHKSHLLFPFLNDLVHHTRIVDAVEDLYGDNLLCWSSNFFIKEAANPAFVSWHQDSTYWGLSRPDVVTAWVALTPSNASNGAIDITASGGQGGYTYDWADIAGTSNQEDRTGLSAGTYTVTVTDADALYVLERGEIIWHGKPGETYPPEVMRVIGAAA